MQRFMRLGVKESPLRERRELEWVRQEVGNITDGGIGALDQIADLYMTHDHA